MTNRKLLLTAVLVSAILLLGRVMPALAGDGLQISLTPSTQELTVGDPVALTLEVDHPQGYQVIIPKLEQTWGPAEVRSQSRATTVSNDDGSQTTSQVIEVTLFDLGDFETPPLPLTISDGAGQVSERAVPAVSLKVIPTLSEDDSELRDIKPQAAMAVPPLWTRLLLGLALVAAAATIGWWAIRRWQGKPFFLGPAADNRPPWQVAYDELGRIEGLSLIGKGWFKEYYTLVTDTLRTYLENQFDLRVSDRTTSELKPLLRQSDLDTEAVRSILDLFAESDLAKFAKFTPDPANARGATVIARSIVDQTRPRPELQALLAEDEPPSGGQVRLAGSAAAKAAGA
ncbi:hypothetical protein ACFLWA_02000 [Chloroflexota bacterium]